MKAIKILTAVLKKNAATSSQMNAMGEAETAGLSQSPTQGVFARLMAQKPSATVQPAAPAPALGKTLPKPALPVASPTPVQVTNPQTGK